MENSLKIQSPPPKPPRRRHLDQPSPSLAGISPTCRNNVTLNSQINNDSQLAVGQFATSCEPLPSNCTYEINLEKNIINPYTYKENNCLHSDSKEKISSISPSKNAGSPKKRISSSGFLFNELNDCLHTANLKKEFYTHPVLNFEHNSLDCASKNLSKSFHIHPATDNITNCASKENIRCLKSSLSENYHRRHNSDPLPATYLNKYLTSFLQTSLINKNSKLKKFEYFSESTENYYLLQEIKSLKEINYKLLEHLCHAQASIENLLNNSNGQSNALCFSDLLLSLYDSLKAKDTAMENRMKLILKERDNALHDLDSMVQTVARNFEDMSPKGEDISSSDKEIKDLLQEIEITYNPAKLLQQQKKLLSLLYSSKELKLDYMYHEMKLLVIERNNLQHKVQLLENELHQLQLSKEIYDSDNKCWESNLLNTLCQAIHQRDAVMKNFGKSSLDHYINRPSVYEISSRMKDCSLNLERASVKKKSKSSAENNRKICNPLPSKAKTDELQFLREEIFVLNESLETELEKSEIAEDKCTRLNKLVKVLQKKLNGQNIGIPV